MSTQTTGRTRKPETKGGDKSGEQRDELKDRRNVEVELDKVIEMENHNAQEFNEALRDVNERMGLMAEELRKAIVDGIANAQPKYTPPADDKHTTKEAVREALEEEGESIRQRVVGQLKHLVPVNRKEAGQLAVGFGLGYVTGGYTGGAIPYIR